MFSWSASWGEGGGFTAVISPCFWAAADRSLVLWKINRGSQAPYEAAFLSYPEHICNRPHPHPHPRSTGRQGRTGRRTVSSADVYTQPRLLMSGVEGCASRSWAVCVEAQSLGGAWFTGKGLEMTRSFLKAATMHQLFWKKNQRFKEQVIKSSLNLMRWLSWHGSLLHGAAYYNMGCFTWVVITWCWLLQHGADCYDEFL